MRWLLHRQSVPASPGTLDAAPTDPARRTPADPSAANALITVVASVASVMLVLALPHSWHLVQARWGAFLTFAIVTFVLQLMSVPVYQRGGYSFSGAGMLAIGFTFGTGAAMTVAATMGIVNLVRRRGRINRGIFDAAQWALAAGLGAATYHALTNSDTTLGRIGPALAAAAVFFVVNIGLLTAAMSISEGRDPRGVFKERFSWIVPYHAVSGPLALALVIAYERTGTLGLVAFATPPAFMMFAARQYLAKTRESVEEVRLANEELRLAIGQLEERNADLKDLLEFAGGLAARAHDRATLVTYAQGVLQRVTGSAVYVSSDLDGLIPLMAGGTRVGSLGIANVSTAGDRWERLREGMLPTLATALESTTLVDQVRRKHLATIAALSRSMEAKDYYTGGHTERVAQIAVAIASRLGYEGADLDAIEIGALLHDIGKIGIPERILHKPGPLNDDDWRLMKEHPVISDYILAEIDLHPFVREIARLSHERIDGKGYPDGLKGDEIPLPARIVLVADAIDALTSDRPYRGARSVAAAMEELRAHTGTQFCPKVVAVVEEIWREEPHVLTGGRLHAVGASA